jgi:hypothetical protein
MADQTLIRAMQKLKSTVRFKRQEEVEARCEGFKHNGDHPCKPKKPKRS